MTQRGRGRKRVREVLRNCRIEANDDGSCAALIQDLGPCLESVSIGLGKKWQEGDKVRVTVELLARTRKG